MHMLCSWLGTCSVPLPSVTSIIFSFRWSGCTSRARLFLCNSFSYFWGCKWLFVNGLLSSHWYSGQSSCHQHWRRDFEILWLSIRCVPVSMQSTAIFEICTWDAKRRNSYTLPSTWQPSRTLPDFCLGNSPPKITQTGLGNSGYFWKSVIKSPGDKIFPVQGPVKWSTERTSEVHSTQDEPSRMVQKCRYHNF